MYDYEGIKRYWRENPCHYDNKWQNRYAFEIRTRAFRRSDFRGLKRIVDIGCGKGDYTFALAKLIDEDARIQGFDFSFNIEAARRRYGNEQNMEFHEGGVPDDCLAETLRNADAAVMTTVYVHMTPEAREKLLEYFQTMKKGAKMFLLEYAPEVVPGFQKDLGHKEVETFQEMKEKFEKRDLILKEVRHVNFIDSFLFHHLGPNFFTYLLTKAGEWFIRLSGSKKSKYKLLIFTNA